MRILKRSGLGVFALCVGLLSCGQLPGFGQSLPGDRRLSGKDVEAAFEPQRQVLQESSVAIYVNGKPMGYGAIMSEDGYILTKNSELYNYDKKLKKLVLKDLMVIAGEQRYKDVKVVAADDRWDVALLKIDAHGLKPVKWAKSSNVAQGSWIVMNGSTTRKRRRVNIGIISAKPREISGGISVVMGVGLQDVKTGVQIKKVLEHSAAEEAGLKEEDIIFKFADVAIVKRKDILKILKDKIAGDKVKVDFMRGKKKMSTTMTLKARKKLYGEDAKKPKSRNDQMSGDFSARRTGFPRVIQTSVTHNSRQTGGPVILLSGEAVGLSIARADRAQSFAIPAENVQEIYKQLCKKQQ